MTPALVAVGLKTLPSVCLSQRACSTGRKRKVRFAPYSVEKLACSDDC